MVAKARITGLPAKAPKTGVEPALALAATGGIEALASGAVASPEADGMPDVDEDWCTRVRRIRKPCASEADAGMGAQAPARFRPDREALAPTDRRRAPCRGTGAIPRASLVPTLPRPLLSPPPLLASTSSPPLLPLLFLAAAAAAAAAAACSNGIELASDARTLMKGLLEGPPLPPVDPPPTPSPLPTSSPSESAFGCEPAGNRVFSVVKCKERVPPPRDSTTWIPSEGSKDTIMTFSQAPPSTSTSTARPTKAPCSFRARLGASTDTRLRFMGFASTLNPSASAGPLTSDTRGTTMASWPHSRGRGCPSVSSSSISRDAHASAAFRYSNTSNSPT